MVEHPLCIQEVPGSIPGFSKITIFNNFNNVLLFSFPFVVLFSSFICLQNAGNVSRRPAQNHCITFTLRSTGTTTKGSFRLLSITQLWSEISIAGN